MALYGPVRRNSKERGDGAAAPQSGSGTVLQPKPHVKILASCLKAVISDEAEGLRILVLSLIQNIALLVALAVAYQIIGVRWRQNLLKYQVVARLLFGAAGVMDMMTPVHFMPGIIFDGRSIILGVTSIPCSVSMSGCSGQRRGLRRSVPDDHCPR